MKILSELFTRRLSPKTDDITDETSDLSLASCGKRPIERRNGGTILLAGLFITVLLFILSLLSGAADISPREIGKWMTGGESDIWVRNIMLHVRFPRSLAALTCGTALALSGLLLQSALHNPLASAGTIGVNSGAGLFAVLSSVIFPGVFTARPILAFGGALISAFLVFGVSQKAGASKSTIIMAGVAVGSLLSAGTDAVVTFHPESVMDKTAFFIGGFAHASMRPVLYVMPLVIAGFAVAALLSARMNVLSLGDEIAASLGLNVRRCRILIIFCAALLAACSVCIGGLLGFVGLIVPHAARFLIGHDHRRLVWFTALLGGGLVLCCDILARVMFSPYELPVGILLSALGAPFFLALILRRRRLEL